MYSYFNECLPRNQVVEQYASALQNTATAYASLRKKYPFLEGVVTTVEWNSVMLNEAGVGLGDCMAKIENHAVRTLIFSWFVNYPVRQYFDESICEDELIEQSYTLSVAGDAFPATNLAIAHNNGTFLFTLGVHADLCKNELALIGVRGQTRSVYNLYSNDDKNIAFIEQFLSDIEASGLSISTQIDKLFNGRVVRTNAYKQSFDKLGVANQQAILDRLKRAQNLGLIDFKVDNDIFRHTSGYDKKEKRYGPVYELRVREPKEIRIYFQYIDNKYYVLSMGGKGTNQNADIGLAFERIKQIREI